MPTKSTALTMLVARILARRFVPVEFVSGMQHLLWFEPVI
jgi:hypothetical protein